MSDVEQKLEENLEYTAAKQLFTELSSVKSQVYMRGVPMNSLLIIGVRRTVAGLVKRYHDQGLLKGENVEVKLNNYSKQANLVFNFSKGLITHRERFVGENIEKMKELNKQMELKDDKV